MNTQRGPARLPRLFELLRSPSGPPRPCSVRPLSLPSGLSGPYNDLNVVHDYHGKLRNARRNARVQGKRYRHTTTIGMLSDDVLLEIFAFCQNHHIYGPRIELPVGVWDWHVLVHVCQRWRQVIFTSPLRLNLRILCTHGTPVRKNLDIWPTFPIHIEYRYPKTIEFIDEDNIIAALEHPDRVHTISLWQTGQLLGKVITVMQEPFPALAHLFLEAHISNDAPVIPAKFLGRSAPCLQNIKLVGIPFPALPALLLSTSDLVTLDLSNIPQTGYIPPKAMVAALATLTRLEDLRFGFQSPTSRPDRIHLPPVTRTVLPALTYFQFDGVREYLEDFVARIYAPRLYVISIEYFNQLVDFEVPQLWQFIEHSEYLNRPMRCLVDFHDKSVSFGAVPATHMPNSESFGVFPRCVDVNIVCEGVDWQVSHFVQVLNQPEISAVLSNMLHLAIVSHSTSPEPEGMDDVEWLQLLRPFSSLQTMFVSKEFAGHISHSLVNTDAVTATEVLPALDMLCLEGQPGSSTHKFLAARSESGRPVTTVDTGRAFKERLMSYFN